MRPLNFCSLLFLLFMIGFVNAQDCCSTKRNPWLLGAGINVIYDSGLSVKGVFNDFQNNYNYSDPIWGAVEKRFKENYGIQITASLNTFLKGKTINNRTLEEDISFFALDGAFKYYITNTYQIKERALYEGYLMIGIGSSFYDSLSFVTTNLGVGINYYLTESIYLNVHMIAKFSLNYNKEGSNYMHYGIGFIIKLEESFFK